LNKKRNVYCFRRELSVHALKNISNNEIDAPKKPKAVRHIILIRHGQYNLSGKTDKERILTDLG
jgi:serine/threonine-protein phosphatase PGAM5